MAKIPDPIYIRLEPEALEVLKRIADALEQSNAQAPDTSFGDRRRLFEQPATWPPPVPSYPAPWQYPHTITGSGYAPARDGEGDHLLNPEADHTGEDTD